MTLITKRENLVMLMLTEQHCSEGRDVISCYLFMLLSTEEPGGDTGTLGTVLEESHQDLTKPKHVPVKCD